MPKRTFFQRVIAYARSSGRRARIQLAMRSRSGSETMYVGDRWSIVTWAARLASSGHERHGGRAAADDDDALSLVVDVRRPLLRVHDAAAEPLAPGELRRVALLVVVVAGAHEEEVARQLRRSGPTRRRATSTVQRASSLDQRARSTRCP